MTEPSSTLRALSDALIPGGPGRTAGSRYPPASAVGVDRDIRDIVDSLGGRERDAFDQFLRALDSRLANFLLGSGPVRFSALAADRRERYLRRWSTSRLAAKRRGFQAAKQLVAWSYFSRGFGQPPQHPLWERTHYAPPALPLPPSDPFEGRRPRSPTSDEDVRSDAVVVGSGAGGAVVAAGLAAAGYRVVVLEAGPWVEGLAYPRSEREATDRLFGRGGRWATADRAISLLAGETAGGSTAVNWMTCLPPLPEARREWVERGGLEDAGGPAFDTALAHVAQRIGVSTRESTVNANNEVLRRGSVALGYREGSDWGIIPRNARGCDSRCGACGFGCPFGARQGAATTYLADAMKAGAILYCSTRVRSVDIEQGRAAGVQAEYRDGPHRRRVVVRAGCVVLAAGTLQTPALLLRSGLTASGVGAGLRLDPTTAVAVEMPDPVRTWEGPPQTVGVYRFQRSAPEAHGPWLEAAPAHPGLAATAVPWVGPSDFLARLEQGERLATLIVLVRDVGEGRVCVDAEGRPRFDYRLTRADREHLLRGIIETARIGIAAGATRIFSLHTPPVEVGDGMRPLRPGDLDALEAGVRRQGIREGSVALFSAHPMGGARAGRDPRTSAAEPSGRVHGVEGLWVADGSLLPSAPGANPMMSIMALASLVAERVRSSLAG